MDSEDLLNLLKECNYSESELLEFKVDNKDPAMIGRSISALSNTAALFGKDRAF